MHFVTILDIIETIWILSNNIIGYYCCLDIIKTIWICLNIIKTCLDIIKTLSSYFITMASSLRHAFAIELINSDLNN